MASSDQCMSLAETLWTNAKQGNWRQVIQLYRDNPAAQTTVITKSGDTALHMAVADEKEYVVEELVRMVETDSLGVQNKLSNTALHLAAYLGNERMCRCIAASNPRVIGIRNCDDETPLFVAAVHGRKEAFLSMHGLCTDASVRKLRDTDYCKRNVDGRTVLHAAISGEHFELAYEIIHLYPRLVNRMDSWRFVPLHLLAKKPAVFRSGCSMGFIRQCIYSCIYVPKLKFTAKESDGDKSKASQTPFGSIFQRIRINNTTPEKFISERGEIPKQDAEDPQNDGQQLDCTQESWDQKHSKGTFFGGVATHIFNWIAAILWLPTFLLGYGTIVNVREEKKKHVWAVQIVEELLGKSKSVNSYQYGGNSYASPPKKDAPPQGSRPPQIDSGEKEGATVDEERKMQESAPTTSKKQDIEELLEKIIQTLGVEIQDEKKKDKAGSVVVKGNVKDETPLLVAAKYGVLEVVKMILDRIPVAVHDVNSEDKNVVLIAVENRQPHIYRFLQDRKILVETIFYKTDKYGNSALHLAAQLSDERNWNIPGPALHMQWEIKWYQFVEQSMPARFFVRYNEKGETAWHIFRETHKDLVIQARKWLTKTSDSCSVVSILIATVAFAAYATVPGGLSDTGAPVLERETAFHVFAISSLIALCFSIASVVMFLVFFTSRYREKDFATNLPAKLLVELTSLMLAVAALLVSFCAAHSYVIRDNLKYTAFPLYAATLLPVAFYVFWQVPMYFQLAYATYQDVPQRIYYD